MSGRISTLQGLYFLVTGIWPLVHGNSFQITSTSANRAARRIVEACRYGEPSLVITPQARLLELLNALFPGLIAQTMKLVNFFLPKPEPIRDDVKRTGWKSQSRLSPSPLTVLADQAVAENNELKGHAPIT